MTDRTEEPGAERVTESQRIYEGRIANLRIDQVELPDGRRSAREIVEHAPVVAVVPLEEDGDVILVRQYRLATASVMLEVPAGLIDPGESPEEAAQRELQEEIKMRAESMEPLPGFYASPGFLDEYIYVFLATGLVESHADGDDDEDIVIVRMPLAEALRLIEAGEIRDGKSITGLLLAARRRGV